MQLKQYSVDTPRQTLLADAQQILKSIPNWNVGKMHYEHTNHATKITHDTIDGDYWCARHSVLKDLPIDKFKSAIIGTTEIGFTHSDHELHYVHEIELMEVRNIKKYEDNGWSYTIHAIYDFGFPLNKRLFNELVHVFVSNDEALVVSVQLKEKLRVFWVVMHLLKKSSGVMETVLNGQLLLHQNQEELSLIGLPD